MFNVLPTFADIGIALVVFIFYFEWTLAVVIFFVISAYSESSQETALCMNINALRKIQSRRV